jgi:3-methyladenine DNA glycosylase AlkC
MTLSRTTVREQHLAALTGLPASEWDDYLDAHSGLSGPRANLELLAAVGDIAPADYLHACAADADEYRAAVGAAGLGRLVVEGDLNEVGTLRALAADERWRVREGVAMALQRIGDADPGLLRRITDEWADQSPLVLRAAIAGVCEPRLLRTADAAAHAVRLVDHATRVLAALSAARRRDTDVRVLRQGLGYCWSVAVAADPGPGFAALERWADTPDDDVRWVLRQNLRKARLARADAAATERLARLVG